MKTYKVYVPWSKTTPELAEATVRLHGSILKFTEGRQKAWGFRILVPKNEVYETPLEAWEAFLTGTQEDIADVKQRLFVLEQQYYIAKEAVEALSDIQEG